VKKIDEEVAKIYICEVLLALEALHKNMIVFRFFAFFSLDKTLVFYE